MAGIERRGEQLGSIRVDEDAEPKPKKASAKEETAEVVEPEVKPKPAAKGAK